jgi:hypothetical protein
MWLHSVLLAGGFLGIAESATEAPETRRLRAIGSVLDEFERVPLVAMAGHFDQRQDHEFLLGMLADSRFARYVDDIVVEFGNARYQDRVDRFVQGEAFDESELLSILRDTTQPLAFDSPVYIQFLAAVREHNSLRPPEDRVRVILGDPSFDWQDIRKAEDLRAVGDRDAFFADVVKSEVLDKGRRALLLASPERLLRRDALSLPSRDTTLGAILTTRARDSLSIVWSIPPKWWAAHNLGLADDPPRFAAVPGSAFAATSCAELFDLRTVDDIYVVGESPTAKVDPARCPAIGEVADAVLYLGLNERRIGPDPAIYLETEYQAELRRRVPLLDGSRERNDASDLDTLFLLALEASRLAPQRSSSASRDGLTYSIELERSAVLAGDPVVVEFGWENESESTLTFDTARGPTGGVTQFDRAGEILDFAVYRDGKQLKYRGGFGCGGAEHVTILRPGEASRVAYDVSSVYDIRQPGEYEIRCAFSSNPRRTYCGVIWRGLLVPAPVKLVVLRAE